MIIRVHDDWSIDRLLDVAMVSTLLCCPAQMEIVEPMSLHPNIYEWIPSEILQEIE